MGFAAISRLRLRDTRDTRGQVSSCVLHDMWGNGIWETEGQTGEKPAREAPLTQQLLWMNVKAAPPHSGEEKRGDPSICDQLPIAIFFPSLRCGVGLLVFVLRFFFSPHYPLIGE